jgi:hypothetical protein
MWALNKKTMFKSLTQNWNFMRFFRLIIGLIALVEAFRSYDILVGIFGSIIVGMAILNAGCGAQGCATPVDHSKKTDLDEVEYEEVHTK